jgi:hypothetical protein
MQKLPVPSERIVLTHFIVSDDVERSRRFYTEMLGGQTRCSDSTSAQLPPPRWPVTASR